MSSTQSAADTKSVVKTGAHSASLALVILLCLVSCGLLLLLNPHTFQVDSVYQGF